VGKWIDAFQHQRPYEWDTELSVEYTLGPPATEQQIADAEALLGARWPAELRELLGEFNGIWFTTKDLRRGGYEPEILFLDIEHLTEQLPDYLGDAENELPPTNELRRVAFFCQAHEFAELWGVCVEPLAGCRVGEVIALDDEGRWRKSAPSLLEFMRRGLPSSAWVW